MHALQVCAHTPDRRILGFAPFGVEPSAKHVSVPFSVRGTTLSLTMPGSYDTDCRKCGKLPDVKGTCRKAHLCVPRRLSRNLRRMGRAGSAHLDPTSTAIRTMTKNRESRTSHLGKAPKE